MSSYKLSKSIYYLGTGLLALSFVIPLVWALVSSVSPAAGTAQAEGYGLGNYVKLFTYELGCRST